MGTEGAAVLEPLWNARAAGRPATTGAASCSLPPRFAAVGDARRFTRQTLGQWGLSELFDSVELVASELVTNALRYACPAGAGPTPVRLSLVHWSTRVICAVRDSSATGPVAKVADFVAESGRGLHLVESCSDAWGWHPLSGTGKVVWAQFAVTPGGRTPRP